MNTPINITSIGRIAVSFGVPIEVIAGTAQELGIQQSRVNGVVHFDEIDVARMANHLRAMGSNQPMADRSSIH